MSSKGHKVKLGDIVDIFTGYPFKSAEYSENPDDIKLIRGDNIAQGTLRWDGVKRWPVDKAEGLENFLLKENDVLLAMDRPWIPAGLKFARVYSSDLPCLLVQRVACLRAKSGQDQNFIYSLLSTPAFSEYIQNVTTGTAVPHISVKQIKEFELEKLSLETEKEVGFIHEIFESRIKLLRETNATLEAIAQALFKSWFVDFDPVHANAGTQAPSQPPEIQALFPATFTDSPQGPIPEGWDALPFTETINVIGGGTPKTSIAEYWGGDIPWFSVVDAPAESDVFVIDTEKHITELGLNNSSTKLLPSGTTIISARGTVGRLALVGRDMAMNQSCYGLRGKYGDDYFTFFTTYRLVEALKQRSHGSVFDTITRDTLAGVSVVYPDKTVVSAFEDSVGSVMEKIKNNLQQAQTLATTRDTLLPRLISGQLRLPEAEQAIAAITD